MLSVYTTPGKSPDSATPRKNLTAKNPARFCVTPWSVLTIPQISVNVGNQILGDDSLRTTLAGTSNIT